MMDDLVKKWDNLGFLNDATNKKNLALALEATLNLMNNDKQRNEEYDTVILPIIKEIFYNKYVLSLHESYIQYKCEFIYKKFKEEYPLYKKRNKNSSTIEEDFIEGFSLKIKNNIKQSSPKPWKFVWDNDPKIVDFDGNVVCLLSTGTIDGVYDTETILENAKILLNDNE